MTGLTGSANCIKYVLFAFNFVFVITGIILISVGVAVAAVYDNYTLFLASNFFSIPTLLIVTGAFIFVIAFFGCRGAIKEHYCMIFSFSVLLGLIFILELAGGISGYVLRNDAESLIKDKLRSTMLEYNQTNKLDVAYLWDEVQRDFHCCGLNNYTDWLDTYHGIPVSCCSFETGALNVTSCQNIEGNTRLYEDGCLEKFSDFISGHAVSLGAAGIVIAVIQFVGIFFACYIAREIRIKHGGTGPF